MVIYNNNNNNNNIKSDNNIYQGIKNYINSNNLSYSALIFTKDQFTCPNLSKIHSLEVP